jgi:cell division protein ZipA
MSELRWILVLVGIAVIGYVYWRARREQRRAERRAQMRVEPALRPADQHAPGLVEPRREPKLGDLPPDLDEPAPPPDVQQHTRPIWPRAGVERERPAPRPAVEQPSQPSPVRAAGPNKIVALRIARRGEAPIEAAALFDVLREEGLSFGEYRIFHRYAEARAPGEQRVAVFSVANMVEPGELDPGQADTLELPGVTLFMVLPGPKGGLSALTEMMSSARRIAAAVDGELLDQHGSTMTRQTADHLRDEVIEFERLHRSEHHAGASDR